MVFPGGFGDSTFQAAVLRHVLLPLLFRQQSRHTILR